MFKAAVQPAIISLFSSTNSEPLALWSFHSDATLPSDSFVHLLNDALSEPLAPLPAAAISPPLLDESGGPDYSVDQTVLQIQSPTLPTTWIQSPPDFGPATDRSKDLGLKHPWMHLQIRNMGREWSLEIGVVDQSNRMGILRFSTFQVSFFLCSSRECL